MKVGAAGDSVFDSALARCYDGWRRSATRFYALFAAALEREHVADGAACSIARATLVDDSDEALGRGRRISVAARRSRRDAGRALGGGV
jgi:hypothetical protein